MGLYDIGIDVVSAKTKSWAEQQKKEVLDKIDDARETVRHSAAGITFGLAALAAAVVGGAYLVRKK